MTDLTQNLIPHGLLRKHHPEVAKELEECGGPWEFYFDGEWFNIDHPSWDDDVVYRLATQKPSIDWSHVSDRFIALATNIHGSSYLYARRPAKNQIEWDCYGEWIRAECFASFRPGTCRWEDSLVMRPGYEEQAND